MNIDQTTPAAPAQQKPREAWRARLEKDVRFFQENTGMRFTTIGNKSIKNARFWENFSKGGTITVEKADEIYEWMATQGFNFNS